MKLSKSKLLWVNRRKTQPRAVTIIEYIVTGLILIWVCTYILTYQKNKKEYILNTYPSTTIPAILQNERVDPANRNRLGFVDYGYVSLLEQEDTNNELRESLAKQGYELTDIVHDDNNGGVPLLKYVASNKENKLKWEITISGTKPAKVHVQVHKIGL
jgi:hypothetical protein